MKMTPAIFEQEIMADLRLRSGLEIRRYIGISNIGKCPRRAYYDIVYGQKMSDEGHRMCYTGYLHERDALARMARAEIANLDLANLEIIAPWDVRVRGHNDGVTYWGDLLEVKSVSRFKFQMICDNDRPNREHVAQVQLYMRYGSWNKAWIVYICRETFEHRVFEVRYDDREAERQEARMKALVRAVDEKKPPRCECRRCGQIKGPMPELTIVDNGKS